MISLKNARLDIFCGIGIAPESSVRHPN